ncbi:TA2R7 protein, partial [Centropus bengalensis]|nr:TA2R7 protein [Centropus bengalensis]
SQDKFNITSNNAIALVIFTVQSFAGMWINAFIVSVICIGLLKKKSFNSNEKILLFLGCSRFGYLCILWLHVFILVIYPWLLVHPIPPLSIAAQTFLHFCNLWVSSCLSGFYCIKIANFMHSCFTFLKAKIDRIVPWLLLWSVLLSLSLSIPVYNITGELTCNNPNDTNLGKYWNLNVEMEEQFFPIFFLSGFASVTAFLAVIFSALLLLFSLYRHKRRMQANSVKNVSMEAHVKATKSILSFLFLYGINVTCSIMIIFNDSKKENPMIFLLGVFENVFPVVHSLVLIFSNPKLEKTLLRILVCVNYKVC